MLRASLTTPIRFTIGSPRIDRFISINERWGFCAWHTLPLPIVTLYPRPGTLRPTELYRHLLRLLLS